MAATLESIQKLPPELREKIYKYYLTIKLRQRTALGWDKVNAAIAEAPFCEHNEQIVKVLFCHKCRYCRRNGLCHMCSRNGVEHFLGYSVFDEKRLRRNLQEILLLELVRNRRVTFSDNMTGNQYETV